VEYYFNELDPTTFQKLINAILIARYGEGVRLMPTRGKDGGQDAVIDPEGPHFFELQLDAIPPKFIGQTPPREGRYIFQVKMHRTNDVTALELTKRVLSDFSQELRKNILNRTEDEKVDFFFLITNVPLSDNRRKQFESSRTRLLKDITGLHSDIWWQDWLTAQLNLLPDLAYAYPQLFAGGKPPFERKPAESKKEELPVAIQILIEDQYAKDSKIKFKQIELNNSLNKLFIDTNTIVKHLTPEEQKRLLTAEVARQKNTKYKAKHNSSTSSFQSRHSELLISTLGVLLDEAQDSILHKIILEGGPGQGKSTITQMLAQIHRHPKIERRPLDPEGRWIPPKKLRIPFRIELQQFANKLGKNWKSVEEYLVSIIKDAAGGREFSVTDLQVIITDFPILLIFDGLDEVGSEQYIEDVLVKITECIDRCENSFHSNLRVVITTRPPAIIGHREHLTGFTRLPIAPMSPITIDQYLQRWLEYQINDRDDRKRVRKTFEKRQNEPHVKALVRNPMQLSVVLYLIEIKEEAFPDRRTELYTEYFQKVIEREITKSPELHTHQDIIKALHEFLGYKIHALTETKAADGTLGYHQLLQVVEEWLKDQKNGTKANELFTLGRDRLGLIVALKGEGENANFGYEIQPVREYFAAAFINNQIVGDSHEAFQEMTRRPYWREVALFLAGMVKHKEKADLISRAKSIDSDKTLGWRQDGRSIILQLLQEGVFSQPSRVFIDGLDFVFELLDPRRVSKQKAIEDVLETIPSLVQQTTDQQKYIDLLSEILDHYKYSDDDYIIYRLYSVASRLFEPEKMRKALMSYEGTSPNIIANVRVGWPNGWNINMCREAQDPTFWEKVPDFKWAEQLWLSSMFLRPYQTSSVTVLPIPHRLHQHLMEFWALDPIPIHSYRSLQTKDSYSNWAVWKLVDYQHKIDFYLDEGLSREQVKRIAPTLLSSEDNLDIDVTGLYPEVQLLAVDLVKIFHDVLKLISNEQPKENLAIHFPVLKKYLEKPGLPSLMACRCAVSLLKCFLASCRDISQISDEWWAIFTDLQIFYNLNFVQISGTMLFQT